MNANWSTNSLVSELFPDTVIVDMTSSSSPTGKFAVAEYIGVGGGVGRGIGLLSSPVIIWGFRIECKAAASWNRRRLPKSHIKVVFFSNVFPNPDPSPNEDLLPNEIPDDGLDPNVNPDDEDELEVDWDNRDNIEEEEQGRNEDEALLEVLVRVLEHDEDTVDSPLDNALSIELLIELRSSTSSMGSKPGARAIGTRTGDSMESGP